MSFTTVIQNEANRLGRLTDKHSIQYQPRSNRARENIDKKPQSLMVSSQRSH